MPIYKGNKEITAIYKGDTPISAIYKGDTLIFSSGTWEQYLYEFIYNSLVPATINNKQVKNKARIKTIYANGVIENQLVENGNFESTSGWYFANNNTTISVSNNIATITKGTNATLYVYRANSSFTTYVANHKYLAIAKVKSSSSFSCRFLSSNSYGTITTISANVRTILAQILSPTNVSGFDCALDDNNTIAVGGTLEISDYMFIDLTQMFGTGNEPTSLSDNRIQKILNSGYIPYNTGTYKGTGISEISSEPYNLFDENWQGGSLVQIDGTEFSSANAIRSDYIEVQPSQTYTFEWNTELAPNEGYFFYYDENKNYITYRYFGGVGNAQVPSNCKYIRLEFIKYNSGWATNIPTNLQTCIHIVGTRTGYAPHKTFTPVALKYQGNGALDSHDILGITSTEYVFTKNIGSVDLGSLNWIQDGNNFRAQLTTIKTTATTIPVNAMCKNYVSVPVDASFVNYNFGCSTTQNLYFRNNNYSTASDFATAMSGTYLYYELATPQVIRIPRKHLGVVDLGTLNWSTSKYGFYTTLSSAKPQTNLNVIGNIICSAYATQESIHIANYKDKEGIAIDEVSHIQIRDTSKSSMTAVEFKTAMSGVYLFYETQDEVTDIPFTVEVESGGTITSDSDVLPNIEFDIKCK